MKKYYKCIIGTLCCPTLCFWHAEATAKVTKGTKWETSKCSACCFNCFGLTVVNMDRV